MNAVNVNGLLATLGQTGVPTQAGTATALQTNADGVGGSFLEALQQFSTMVAGQGELIATTATSTAQTPANLMAMLSQLFNQQSTLSTQMPDPTGEALNITGSESTLSLTDMMVAVQSMVKNNQTPKTLMDENTLQLLSDIQNAEEANLGDIPQSTLLAVAELIAPQTPLSQPQQTTLTAGNAETGSAVNTAQAITAEAIANGNAAAPNAIPVETNATGTINTASTGNTPQTEAAIQTQASQTNAVAAQTTEAATAPATSGANAASFEQTLAGQNTSPTNTTTDAALNTNTQPNGQPTTQQTAQAQSAAVATPAQPSGQANPASTATAANISTAEPIQVESATHGTNGIVQPQVQTGQVSPTATTTEVTGSPRFELPNIPALHQIADSVEMLTQKGQTSVRLHLRPESLGHLTIQMHVVDGEVSVKMMAQSVQAQALIQDHLPQLKAAFTAQGLATDQLNVDVDSGASGFNNPQQQAQDWAQQSNQPHFGPFFDNPGSSATTTVSGAEQHNAARAIGRIDYQA